MRRWSKVPPGRIARIIGAVLAGIVALVVAASAIAWSGVYDIAASRGHWAVVEWILEFGMRNSVARHAVVTTRAIAIKTPALDNPDLVRLGASHYHRGCAFCHGAPGMPVNPIAQRMLPSPPDLTESMRRWKLRELFWIVKHGFKYTGMPSWVALEREDEIWAVVAFLKRLPTLDARGYRDLALGGVRVSQQSGRELATLESNPEAVGACARCHGAEGQRPMSDLVPVLDGQPADFLMSALKAYAEGKRRSGIMQPMATDLQADDMRLLADYYAGLAPPQGEPRTTDAVLIETGRKLAVEGAPDNGVLPCLTCHGRDAPASYPHLAGQNAAYIAGQLRLRKMGHVPATDGAAIMAPIAQRLSDRQIDAVSAYFATHAPTLAAPPGGGDVTAAEIMTPLERVASTPKGQLKSPYADFASAAEEGHRKYMAAGCNGCHGGGGGGGMAPPLTNPVWIYGDDDDTLFRLIALGTGNDAFEKLGYRRKGSEVIVGPMPDFGEIIKTDDDLWKIIAWIRSAHCSRRVEDRC